MAHIEKKEKKTIHLLTNLHKVHFHISKNSNEIENLKSPSEQNYLGKFTYELSVNKKITIVTLYKSLSIKILNYIKRKKTVRTIGKLNKISPCTSHSITHTHIDTQVSDKKLAYFNAIKNKEFTKIYKTYIEMDMHT